RERRAADFVKVGLFPAAAEVRRAVIAALAPIATETPLIAVLFADGDPDLGLLDDLKAAGFRGAMIDTMGKGSGGLLKHKSLTELRVFVERCRALGLLSGLAGSLEAPDIPRLAVLSPDYLGFRSALTAGRREDAVDPGAMAVIRGLIDLESGRRGEGSEKRKAERRAPPTDRIFVRDFTLDMEIGAYGFERGRLQRVRFGIEADVQRADARVPSEMADIYSYDIIMDAVRDIVARGHTGLVETLAEELAATVLNDRRVETVIVKVEKLDLGPAAVGVEISRSKAH
ncbi:MAG: dihydroneopterin aldolase, partial [Rhizobiaceae bacterium]|nr:dihydroneopterin aldolase [Rhizobiaceae bacterium]